MRMTNLCENGENKLQPSD